MDNDHSIGELYRYIGKIIDIYIYTKPKCDRIVLLSVPIHSHAIKTWRKEKKHELSDLSQYHGLGALDRIHARYCIGHGTVRTCVIESRISIREILDSSDQC